MPSRPYTFETGADLEVFRTIPLILTTLQGKKRNRITVTGSRCHSPRTRPPRTAERLRPCWQEALCDGSGARTEQAARSRCLANTRLPLPARQEGCGPGRDTRPHGARRSSIPAAGAGNAPPGPTRAARPPRRLTCHHLGRLEELVGVQVAALRQQAPAGAQRGQQRPQPPRPHAGTGRRTRPARGRRSGGAARTRRAREGGRGMAAARGALPSPGGAGGLRPLRASSPVTAERTEQRGRAAGGKA